MYFMTVNKFTDLSAEDFKSTYLKDVPVDLYQHSQYNYGADIEADVPKSFDWRQQKCGGHHGACVSYVKDQGACGSCWAFSAVETLESHYAIRLNTSAPILSTQQVTGCTPNPDQCGGTGGCDGNIQTLAFNYTARAGVTAEVAYPYNASSTCDATKIKPCVRNTGFVRVKVNDYDAHMHALVSQGPLSISLAATSMQFYGG